MTVNRFLVFGVLGVLTTFCCFAHELPVQFEVVHGGAHGGKAFYNANKLKLIKQFLHRHLALSGDEQK